MWLPPLADRCGEPDYITWSQADASLDDITYGPTLRPDRGPVLATSQAPPRAGDRTVLGRRPRAVRPSGSGMLAKVSRHGTTEPHWID
jgi:hypothetical protein